MDHYLRDDVMTIQGTVDKTGISLALLIFAGYFAYVPDGFSFMIVGGLGGFIVAIVTILKKHGHQSQFHYMQC